VNPETAKLKPVNRPLMVRKMALLLQMLLITILAGCASTSRVVIDSENQNTRVNIVVIHFTSSDFSDSLHVLTKATSRPVSSHYLIPEPDDPSYTKKQIKLHQLVDESARAWHAGVSYWGGKIALNDMSIGIELVNRTYCHQTEAEPAEPVASEDTAIHEEKATQICFYPDYTTAQIDMLTDLLGEILERHPDVKPNNIIGHADIAPQRKIDPGYRFPWQRLARLGYGAWFDDEAVIRYWEQFRIEMPTLMQLQDALNTYGYEIELTGEADEQSRNVIRAFQMHFAPGRVTGSFDPESAAKLFALIEKYKTEELSRLLTRPAPEAVTES
jgi:N-acetylmuramoyl-L-alanine amidase